MSSKLVKLAKKDNRIRWCLKGKKKKKERKIRTAHVVATAAHEHVGLQHVHICMLFTRWKRNKQNMLFGGFSSFNRTKGVNAIQTNKQKQTQNEGKKGEKGKTNRRRKTKRNETNKRESWVSLNQRGRVGGGEERGGRRERER